MSPLPRHTLDTRDNQYPCGPTSYVPRNRTLSRPSPSFSSASEEALMVDSHFSLSSASNSRYPEWGSWDAVPDRHVEPDNFSSLAFDGLSDVETYDSLPMMMSTLAPYSYPSGDFLPHVSDVNQGQVMHAFAPLDYVDYNACTSSVDMNSASAACFPMMFQGPPSPPDEDEVEQELAISKPSPSQGSRLCEAAVEMPKLQPYRGANRGGSAYHRVLMPYSARTNAEQISRHVPSPKTPLEESHENKSKARKDPRYSASPDADGWFRCPLVATSGCTHKPTKQRCIYAKYLDSHLRPYKCKSPACIGEGDDARFSSNACLFRHEREAHGMHCHGMNPYLCKFPNCPRSRPENGFPRSWNQRDHMKRVHQWTPQKGDEEAPSRRSAPDSRRPKATSLPGSVPMKRSSSSHYVQRGCPEHSRRAVSLRDQVETYGHASTTTDNVMPPPYDVSNLSYSEYPTQGFFC